MLVICPRNNKPMTESNSSGKRIAKNTIVLYFRMIFLMLVTLYTSRVFLDALGVEDYGIYNVVGGFVGMFALISAALTGACTRFLNYEMGKSDLKRQTVVFSTALSIQIALAVIVFVLAEIIGLWYVNNIMVLPSERLIAANWCFQFSVITFCFELISVPYNASIIAHERMTAFAFVSIYEGIAKLIVTFLIFVNPFDRLIFYALLLCFIQATVMLVYFLFCKKNFEECRFIGRADKPLLKHMLSYSLWHLVGNGSAVLKTHGVNLLLNLFYGPAVNAARGLASQVDGAVNQFSGNFMMAMNPQITQSYSQGNLNYTLNLVNKGARLSFYLMLLVSLPLIMNTEYILSIWLKEVPDYTVIFSQIALIAAMITSISRPLITAQNATGNVRNYQLVVGGIQLLNLPLSYVGLVIFDCPEIVVIVALFVEIIALFARIYMIPKTIPEFKPNDFLRLVCLKCLVVTVIIVPVLYIIKLFTPDTLLYVILNIIIDVVITCAIIFFIGCDQSEKEFILSKLSNLTKK